MSAAELTIATGFVVHIQAPVPFGITAVDDAIHVMGVTVNDGARLIAVLDVIGAHSETYIMASGGFVCSNRALTSAVSESGVPPCPRPLPTILVFYAWLPWGIHVPNIASLDERPRLKRCAVETAMRTLAARRIVSDILKGYRRALDLAMELHRDALLPVSWSKLLAEVIETDANARSGRTTAPDPGERLRRSQKTSYLEANNIAR